MLNTELIVKASNDASLYLFGWFIREQKILAEAFFITKQTEKNTLFKHDELGEFILLDDILEENYLFTIPIFNTSPIELLEVI